MSKQATSLWRLARYENGFPFRPDDFGPAGTPVIRIRQLVDPSAETDLTEREVPARYLLKNGDLVFSWSGSLAVTTWTRGPAWLNQHLFKVIPAADVDQRWLRWTIEASIPRFEGLMHGSAMTHLTLDMLKQLPVDEPSLDEQRRMADFLDAETARIDALAKSRRSQISVLGELELARIGEHLSASDISGPVYAYFDVQLGKMLNAERASGGRQQVYLRNANVHWYEIDTEDMATMTFEPDDRVRYGIQAGDLLVCEGGAGVAEAAVWDGRISTCFYQKSLHRVRSRSHVPVEWLMYWLRYSKAIGVFNADGNLATIPHLTGEQLAEYKIPIPDDGQRRVDELAADISAIREAQRKMAVANNLLAERRQALITAAVTGGISV